MLMCYHVPLSVSAIFPYRPEQLIKILSDLRVRSTWDLKFHKGTCMGRRWMLRRVCVCVCVLVRVLVLVKC